MKKSFCTYILILACGAFFAGGCAKREMVKRDETGAPAVAVKAVETSPATKPLPVEPGIKGERIKEDPVADRISNEIKNAAMLEANLERIYFDFDSYLLAPAARDTLAKNAKIMKENGGARYLIEGHCDERGSDEYNLALGDKRARSAMQYLVTMGVAADKLDIISYGEEKPVDPDHTEEAWAVNRRDEFVMMKK